MKKLNLTGIGQILSKEQMKNISGGYGTCCYCQFFQWGDGTWHAGYAWSSSSGANCNETCSGSGTPSSTGC